MKKQIIINPQWQGGNDPVTCYSAEELERFYLSDMDFTEVPVYRRPALQTEHHIIGFPDIKVQMESASALLREHKADRIFAVGGGCDADIPVMAYLNERYEGDLLVKILISGSGLFPRTIRKPLTPGQFIQFGGRDFDQPEIVYMKKTHMCHIPPKYPDRIWKTLEEKTYRHIYVHLDLDVIDPEEFPNTPLPVGGGVSQDFLLRMLRPIIHHNSFVGLGLYEYAPCNLKLEFINTIMQLMTGE